MAHDVATPAPVTREVDEGEFAVETWLNRVESMLVRAVASTQVDNAKTAVDLLRRSIELQRRKFQERRLELHAARSVIKRLLLDTGDIELDQLDQGFRRVEVCEGGSVYEVQLNWGEVSLRRIGGTEAGRG